MAIGLSAALAVVAMAFLKPAPSTLDASQIARLGAALQEGNTLAPLRELRAAARQGNTAAMRVLGTALIGNADYSLATEGLHFAEEAAGHGDADAQFVLAKAYFDGFATITKLPDMGRARTWFEIAAERNHAAAMYYLGLIYRFGYGVERDPALAAGWFEKAASMGNTEAGLIK